MRCRPDEVGRDREAVAKAVRLLEQSEEAPGLTDLAAAVGYAPHHFQRIFTRMSASPRPPILRALRAKRAKSALGENGSVTEAIYEAGYSGPSRFYADAKERLGMTPSAWRDGGRGETIRYVIAESPLGPLLVAATSKGICRLTFDEDVLALLKRRFPNATIVADDGTIWSGRKARPPDGHPASGADAGTADRRPRHGIPGSRLEGAAQDPARRDAQLCRDRGGSRSAKRCARRRHRERFEPRPRYSCPATA